MDGPVFLNFDMAARAALSFLHGRLGFELWMVTRTQGDDWIVLQAEDHGYDVKEGTVFRWADSFCSRMVEGQGPRIAPRSAEVQAYASAAIGRQVQIAAYVGVPLTGPNGALFGTLCAIDRQTQPEAIRQELELVEMVAGLLSALLRAETQYADEARRAERVQAEALSDALTGLFNRRGWTRLLAGEEERCRRYGHPAAVFAIDLDDFKAVNDSRGHFAGDELLARVGSALATVARGSDVAARVGGDEFALLAVECDAAGCALLLDRLRLVLEDSGVKASIGVSIRDPARGLQLAWEQADIAMYANKRRN